MEIKCKYFDGRYTHETTAHVEKFKTYKGYDIYRGTDGWLYINIQDEWHYFGSVREAHNYINQLAIN